MICDDPIQIPSAEMKENMKRDDVFTETAGKIAPPSLVKLKLMVWPLMGGGQLPTNTEN